MARLSKDYSERVKEEEGNAFDFILYALYMYIYILEVMYIRMARLSKDYSERVKEG
jgi:hypothetical protein